MKWVKASERMPELVQEVNAKYNERPISGQFLQPDKRYNVFFDDGNLFTIPKHLFSDLYWLDETESPAPDGWVRFSEVDVANGLYDVWVEEITRPVRHYYAGGRWINQEKIMLPEYYGIEFIKPLPQPPKQ